MSTRKQLRKRKPALKKIEVEHWTRHATNKRYNVEIQRDRKGRFHRWNPSAIKPHRLSGHTPSGRVWVNPAVTRGDDKRRLRTHEKTFVRERKKGKSRTEAIASARKAEHRGLSKKQVAQYEGRMGRIARSLLGRKPKPQAKTYRRPARPLFKPQERPSYVTTAIPSGERVVLKREYGRRREEIPPEFAPKRRIVFYGTQNGMTKRIVIGGRRNLQEKAAVIAYRHPPRKRFQYVPAEELIMEPEAFVDESEGWSPDYEVYD